MHTKKLLYVVFLIQSIFFSGNSYSEVTYWYPDEGRLTFNGDMRITMELDWTARPFQSFWDSIDPEHPAGFEIDAVIRKSFLNRCSSSSTFLDQYDDCPTSGVSEDTNQWSFGCGTYDGSQFSIEATGPNVYPISHLCEITFSRNYHRPAKSSDVGVNAQIITREICPFKSPWCFESERTERLNNANHQSSKFVIEKGKTFSGTWGGFTSTNSPPYAQSSTGAQVSEYALQSEIIVPLSVGAINAGAFGKNYGTNEHDSYLKAQFNVNTNLTA